ncbi:hypothetical protein CDD80_271 [Ophiocordyceps camponoti-rufipedis]|uniref:ubiquitinyl hydrolase 1 n=1 Tax=Ophiocordyceps camponoti-rufipedis TaxID=2004952 RepID=A0A2C5YM42_9HYPO|nr:hypothetical protein CDD80_271 [Ophiocordyceps camponoti-rufipedis]
MFHPQPTPFASSPCFASELPSNGIGFALGFGIPPPPQLRTSRPRAAAGPESRYLYAGGGSSSGPSPSEAAPNQPQPHGNHLQHNHNHHHHQNHNNHSHSQLQQHFHFPHHQAGSHPHHQQPHHHHHHHHHHRPLSYRPASASAMDDHDMAAQQEAAKDYQPVLEGPLVGDKTSSNAITHEYAKADQVYVEKTMALPQTYSHYRPIQGDGNCGWRAIGFSYLEKLIETTDRDAIQAETARLISYNQMLATVGGYNFFEDWSDEMMRLMRDLSDLAANPTAARATLMQNWNTRSIESALIYYLRLLAATYLKSNAETYDPFVPGGQGVSSYCSQSIELPDREIEHLGIVALANILLQPAGLALEIAYLDLSPGSQVNHHRFTDETPGQRPPPPGRTIYLLYRPDHYDILYRALQEATPPAPEPVNVFRADIGPPHEARIAGNNASLAAFSTVDFGAALSMIPGLSAVSPSVDAFSPPQSSWAASFVASAAADDARQTATATAHTPTSQSPTTSGPLGPSPPMLSGGALGMDAPQKQAPLFRTAGDVAAAAGGYPIRFSPVQYDYEKKNSFSRESSFQVKTNTFKNSIWNRAHYGNPDFHPEEWSPDDESVDGRAAGKRRGKKEREA